jgi:type II secretory pathway component PulF
MPLREAVARRQLPSLYVHLVQIGAQGNDLPGILTLLADYYQRRHNLWTRLTALMVYPGIVLAASLTLSVLLFGFSAVYTGAMHDIFSDMLEGRPLPGIMSLGGRNAFLVPTILFLIAAVLFVLALVVPAARNWARWHLPGFRESSLSQFAATMRILLAAGTGLPEALRLVSQLQPDAELARPLERWQSQLAAGAGKISELARQLPMFPPLFLWLVGQAGEDLVAGFARAAALYQERARHRVEMLLYAALPAAVVGLGALIICQLLLGLRVLGIFTFLDMLGGMD